MIEINQGGTIIKLTREEWENLLDQMAAEWDRLVAYFKEINP